MPYSTSLRTRPSSRPKRAAISLTVRGSTITVPCTGNSIAPASSAARRVSGPRHPCWNVVGGQVMKLPLDGGPAGRGVFVDDVFASAVTSFGGYVIHEPKREGEEFLVG